MGREARGIWWLESSSSRGTTCSIPPTWRTCIRCGIETFWYLPEGSSWHILGSTFIWHVFLSPWKISAKLYFLPGFALREDLSFADFRMEPHCSTFYLDTLSSRGMWKNSLVGIASGWTVGIYVCESWMFCSLWTQTSFKAKQSEKYNCFILFDDFWFFLLMQYIFWWWKERHGKCTILVKDLSYDFNSPWSDHQDSTGCGLFWIASIYMSDVYVTVGIVSVKG